MVIEDVDGEEENEPPNEESNKGINLVNDSMGSDSNSVPKGNNSKKSGRKMKIEEVDDEEPMMNGHVETNELKGKDEEEILGNGEVNHAGGDTDKSKDIWTEEHVEKQLPVKTCEKGDSVSKNNIARESKTEGAIEKTNDHVNDKDRTKESVQKESVESGALTEKVGQEQTTKENEENETGQSAEDDKDTENSDDSDADVAKNPLTRPVFYQKPFPANCVKLREDGNTLFKNGQYGDAISRYSKVIGTLENGR